MRKLIFLFLALLAVNSVCARGKYDNPDTIVVTRDGTGDFRTVGEAIEACRAFMEYHKVIYIKKGIYKEKLIVPSWLTNVEICGEDCDSTIITWDDHANIKRPEDNKPMGTFRTYTLKIEGEYITVKNITIENNAARLGQAVTVHTEGDHMCFINCRILGNQDTVYTGVANTKIYFKDCYIEGTTDFIFGPSIAWFENCTLKSKINSYVTAASTPQKQAFGYVFNHCKLIADEGVDKVYLGRPWRAYAYTTFMNCELGKHIVAEGWMNWTDYHNPAEEGIVRYNEYNNKGEGAQTGGRVKWAHQLTKKDAEKITLSNVFNKDIDWIK